MNILHQLQQIQLFLAQDELVLILEQLTLALVIRGGGLKLTAYQANSLLITVLIGVDPVLSNKYRWFGLRVLAKHGILVYI